MVPAAILIQEARRRAGLSQAELARRAGTTQSVIARYETARVQPSLERLQRLVEACGLFLTVGLTTDDPHDVGLVRHALNLTPEERLRQMERMLEFVREGRRALADARG